MPYVIDNDYSSPNVNERIRFLVLHYTAGDFESLLKILTDPKRQVSAHYLVPEWPFDGKRKIFQLVPEEKRAWHAGVSAWQDRINLNDTSIGVEMVNLGYIDKEGERTWIPFTNYQIETVIELCTDIIGRYKDEYGNKIIRSTRVVAHADVAPGRKVDPGPLFPWKKLYDRGIGAWYDEEEKQQTELLISDNEVDIKWVQKNLRIYGYPILETGIFDRQTKQVVQAFQMHFRPNNYSGTPDKETCAILNSLVKKYYYQQAFFSE
ncbi:N-acetylmuramoyl-L-alanine amidase [Coxiella endosymbiont of Ornithodoros amblus]|uniref:N-acetylmuramoyl-L-alanine amidase n=1 Tax=Coxiella endosymbiont of Ornithodoros amblus TaxID=1656166 RepID=UPI00244DD474|nr:N-acetylmuramoyl-L-alanine amidase [Coxiella endosymbiont of Ornithodoros amblus]MBW5802946.1 N-acetylmuramoyl-L-alanine amidase [Coxiella endosymbiont of Ornithodoros amblus]